MLSCYDYPTTLWAEEAGVDIILVGDSVGVKMLGYENPGQVTMDDMLHHLKAVQRAVKDAYLIADLPISSCMNHERMLEDSRSFIDHGADAVKIETLDIRMVEHLTHNQIDVCADIIYPFFLSRFEATGPNDVDPLVEFVQIAIKLQKVGVTMMVLTLVPEEVAKTITEILEVPTIGIGSGKYTDGQVLIAVEMLGICNAMGNGIYNHKYDDFAERGCDAIKRFVSEAAKGEFPRAENCKNLEETHYAKFIRRLKEKVKSA